MQLGADAAVIAVDDFGQLLIIGEAFFIKKRFLKLAFADGDVTMITMAQPPAAILRIFSKYSSSARPKVVGAKMMRFFNSKPP